MTLADGDAGSIPAFVAKMNRAAAALGLTGTHYSTPVGVDTPGNYSTPPTSPTSPGCCFATGGSPGS